MGAELKHPFLLDLSQPRFKNEGVKALVCGMTGAGKTAAVAVIIEEVHGLGLPFLVVDPRGEYRSLNELPGVVTLGAHEEDNYPVNYPDGQWLTVAMTLLERGAGVVVSLKGIKDDGYKRIAYTQLMRRLIVSQEKTLTPMFLVIEEAHLFAPQKRVSDADSLGITVQIGREGRKSGINCIMATQRPRDLEADLDTQHNLVFCGHIEHDLDYEAVKSHLTVLKTVNGREKYEPIPPSVMMGLTAGDFFVRIGAKLHRVQVRRRRTTHLGETPEIVCVQRPLFDLDEILPPAKEQGTLKVEVQSWAS